MSSPETEILAANEAFYEAFAGGDIDAIDALWSDRLPVACIHPGWDALHGRAEVMGSLRAIFDSGGPPPIRCVGAVVYLLGESAYVICGESLGGAQLTATNVFVREEGAWRLVHHQAGPVNRRNERRVETTPNRTLN